MATDLAGFVWHLKLTVAFLRVLATVVTFPRLRQAGLQLDKKQKKRLDVINKKLTNLRQQLSGSRQQADDLNELKELEDQIAKLEAEAAEIKASK